MKNENKVTIEIRGKENCEQTIFLKNDNTNIMFYNDGRYYKNIKFFKYSLF